MFRRPLLSKCGTQSRVQDNNRNIFTMAKIRLHIARFAAVLAGAALCACSEEEVQISKKVYDTVEVAYPQKKMIEVWDEYSARLDGEKSVEIRARVSGYLDKILFRDGDFVKAGSVLFEIDARPFQAIVDANKATVSEIEAKIELAKNNLKRAEELYLSNAVSKEVLETRKSEMASQKAMLMSAQAKLREAQLNLEFTKVTSPITGYVSRRRVDEGNLIDGSSTLMATVVSRDVIYAYFQVSERDVLRYAKNNLFSLIDSAKHDGPPVKIKLMDEDEPSHFGKLTYVDNSLSAASIELRAEIENKDGMLIPGMYAMASLRGGEPRMCLLVPELAVGTDLVDRFVLVVKDDNTVETRIVEVGDVIGNMQIIESGLTDKDKVVINGLQRAVSGGKVTPVLKELK